jgi:hypothetical protein
MFSFQPASDIVNLDGLTTITSVSGNCVIRDNQLLENVDGLINMTFVGGELYIYHNDSLSSVNGFSSIDSIGTRLIIIGNDNLESLSGLEGLSEINDDLCVSFNDNLTDMSSLLGIHSVGGGLYFSGNDGMTTMYGLNNINSIGGELEIKNNENLTDISDIGNLQNIISLDVSQNDKLESLTGLDNVDAQSLQKITIRYNLLLYHCAVESICSYLALPGADVSIGANFPGCNSPGEVEEACLSVYIDDISFTENQINVYPNPVFDQVNISAVTNNSGNIILRIFNCNGALLEQKQYSNHKSGEHEIHLNIGSYTAGMYFVQLQAGKDIITKKLIKK